MPPALSHDLETRRAEGLALRAALPLADQGRWAPAATRPEPVALLAAAVAHRDPDLLPYRWGRMAQSPFYFLRGNAALMAEDLGRSPVSGLRLQLCGDAHLINLGAYAAPDGSLVFDLNDFDEACRGPWEWDLKRLVVSVVLAGREAGHGDGACVEAVQGCVRAYRETLRACAALPLRLVAREDVREAQGHAPLAPIFEKARRETPDRLAQKALDPGPRFKDLGYGLRPLTDAEAAPFLAALGPYGDTLPAGHRELLGHTQPRACARRVSGCGSLGVRNVLVLLEGHGPGDRLFLEFKAQHGSAWATHAEPPPPRHLGWAVMEAQQRLQTWTDPFLGFATVEGAPFLVKQWSDHKASMEIEGLAGAVLPGYAALCGRVLAKGHARSGEAARLWGYVGDEPLLDEALATFAVTHADHVTRDWETFRAAIQSGRLPAEAP